MLLKNGLKFLKPKQPILKLNQFYTTAPNNHRQAIQHNKTIHGFARDQKFSQILTYFSENASKVFTPDSITLKSVLKAHIHLKNGQDAIQLFREMKQKYGVTPDAYHASMVLNGLIEISPNNPTVTEQFFSELITSGFNINIFHINIMIKAYARSLVVDKLDHLEKMIKNRNLEPDQVTFSSLIYAYGRCGKIERAEELFQENKAKMQPDLLAYSTMIQMYANAKNFVKATYYYSEMTSLGYRMNMQSLTNVLQMYVKMKNTQQAENILLEYAKDVVMVPEYYLVLIQGYIGEENVQKAWDNFVKYCSIANHEKFDHISVQLLDLFISHKNMQKIIEFTKIMPFQVEVVEKVLKSIIDLKLYPMIVELDQNFESNPHKPKEGFSLQDWILKYVYRTESFDYLYSVIQILSQKHKQDAQKWFEVLVRDDIANGELERAQNLLKSLQNRKIILGGDVYNELIESCITNHKYTNQIAKMLDLMRSVKIQVNYLPLLKFYVLNKNDKMIQLITSLCKESNTIDWNFYKLLCQTPKLLLQNLDQDVAGEIYVQLLIKTNVDKDYTLMKQVLNKYRKYKL